MTDPTRAARSRRVTRRPGWVLLTTLLVLAIVASSALVFTNRVELLKLAVIVALWAAVVAAFVSFIYRRQSDIDQAKARDLKFVYDLQLDREISARREYELSVESQLRRELTAELRSQTSDEVASLRAELAALRANLEIIFDTDLQHRPAIETERTSVHTFPDWDAAPENAGGQERRGHLAGDDRGMGPGRVISSRIDTEDEDDTDPNTEESPIIDVPVEPEPPEYDWGPAADFGGAHRRASEAQSAQRGWQPTSAPEPTPPPPPPPPAPTPPPPAPEPQPQPAAQSPWQEPVQPARHTTGGEEGWRPAPAEGQFIPAGNPGSNWISPVTTENGSAAQRPTPPEPAPPATPAPPPPAPAMTPPPAEVPRGRHADAGPTVEESPRRARHSAPSDVDPGRHLHPPTLATSPPPPTSAPPPPPAPPSESERAARHRGADEPTAAEGQHIGGQPLSELLARLQVSSTEGGRRRRREE
ncbi:DUF6779 domain-containing protein [Mycobacterium sp. URHB0044]|uniref:DUF6779 domain-containing protein n=1 Tax=Mycobacterium sp. URHB0044 TaxID=1380386 RepID=UPI00048D3728|nr:DUF6779 domain-containing protein [Mycobacterium sp. URHB0044]